MTIHAHPAACDSIKKSLVALKMPRALEMLERYDCKPERLDYVIKGWQHGRGSSRLLGEFALQQFIVAIDLLRLLRGEIAVMPDMEGQAHPRQR